MTSYHGPHTQFNNPKHKGLLIMRGLPASGKTTYAHHFVRERRAEGWSAIRIGRDDVSGASSAYPSSLDRNVSVPARKRSL